MNTIKTPIGEGQFSIKLASVNIGNNRIYCRIITTEQISEIFYGLTITFFIQFSKTMLTGTLLRIDHDRIYFKPLADTDLGVISLSKKIPIGFAPTKMFIEDIENEDLQKNPGNYSDNFNPEGQIPWPEK